MSNIDIKELNNIREKLDAIGKDDVLYIDENGSSRFVIMPIELFDDVTEEKENDEAFFRSPQIRVINADQIELSYDEYEKVKEQIMEAFDKTFKPKPEKLN